MNNKLLHTPEGVRDLYSAECIKREQIIESLRKTIRSYGYDAIKTPSFEFLDVFSGDITEAQMKKFYRFFDREGNTMVLRPDFTPSIARAYVKYFKDEIKSTRLYYEGKVFLNNDSLQGRLKENVQFGAELIGDPSIDADGEILSLVVNSLKKTGLDQFQISIGHAGIFKGLIKACDFNIEQSEDLSQLIINRNFFGVEEFLEEQKVSKDLIQLFKLSTNMFSSCQEWEELLEISKSYEDIYKALKYLKDLADILEIYEVSEYFSFEPGCVSNYEYYTGIIFSGYTFGSGQPIVKGGRYDKLLSNFGKDEAAIGFAITIDQLQLALERQGNAKVRISKKDVILYTEDMRLSAIKMANELRDSGKKVELVVCKKEDIASLQESYSHSNVMIIDGE